MGTRSLTRIIPRQEGLAYDKAHERPELALVNIYQQYDGYPEYMAVEYAKWLEGLSIGNGLGRTPQLNRYANGPGCFAAQFIKHSKNAPAACIYHLLMMIMVGQIMYTLCFLKNVKKLIWLYMIHTLKKLFL